MQKQSFATIRQSSTKIDQASLQNLSNSAVIFIWQQFSTTFSDNIQQHSTKFFVECWRKMSNAVNWWRKILSKNVVELRQYFSTIIFDKVLQHLTKNLSNDVEICFMLAKFTVEKSWRKFLSKNAGEKCCRIIIRQYFSTHFYSKFLGLFVN